MITDNREITPKERNILEHQVNERIKQFGLKEMELHRFTTYFLLRLTQMNDEQFEGWINENN